MSAEEMFGESMDQPRLGFKLTQNARFIEPEQFVRLLVSRKKLVRVDDKTAGIRGLFEPSTGKRFFIEEEKLLASEPTY